MWDVGGQQNLRQSWVAYYSKVKAVIFVIDASETDPDRISQSTLELTNVLKHPELKDKPVIVFANKCDRAQSGVRQIRDAYGLDSIESREDLEVQLCSAVTG